MDPRVTSLLLIVFRTKNLINWAASCIGQYVTPKRIYGNIAIIVIAIVVMIIIVAVLLLSLSAA